MLVDDYNKKIAILDRDQLITLIRNLEPVRRQIPELSTAVLSGPLEDWTMGELRFFAGELMSEYVKMQSERSSSVKLQQK
jgi:hypothetical protein